MKRTWIVGPLLVATTMGLAACGGEESKPPSNEDLASQIQAAYVPAKACWDSFRDASCPDVLATVKEALKAPYQELQQQGGREQSVREIASVQSRWDEWLQRCMDDYSAMRNATYCLQEAPGSGDLNTAIDLVKQGK